MGFRDADTRVDPKDREALWRACTPYYDHFLDREGALQRWNDNPLLYGIDANDPLKEPSPEQAQLIGMVNSFLYVCSFSRIELHDSGVHLYTNAADWSLYFQPVQDPTFFSVGERRLYGTLHSGGHHWTRSAFTLPVECNRLELTDRIIDMSLVNGVTALFRTGRAPGYLFPVRTFMLGTGDNHRWRREDDFPFIWGAVEQLRECDPFASCANAQAELKAAAATLSLSEQHSISFVRAVMGPVPDPRYAWQGEFRPGRDDAVNKARANGLQFSAVERALDELNFARNRVVHDGFISALVWDVVSLAFLGARFWVVTFKRILEWEGVRPWTEGDECERVGLHAFAMQGQDSIVAGYAAYRQALNDCYRAQTRKRVLEHLDRLTGGNPP